VPEQAWFRSLYWRIALGFVALLAALLAVQGAVFLWLTGRTAELLPGRSPTEFAQVIATDVSGALATQPDLDLDAYLNARYTTAFRSFAVVLRDGRQVLSRRVPPPPMIGRAARVRLMGGPQIAGGRGGRGFDPTRPAGEVPPRGGESGRGGGRGVANFEFAPIMVAGTEAGMVAVPTAAPPVSVLLQTVGPTLATVAIGLLVAGTALAALLIFGPAHRRLRALQQAARAIGAGRLDVRAAEGGGDEVASLAHAFNEMAGGLEERTEALMVADRTRRQLLADVSHELMTPLAAIRGYVETLGMPDVTLDEPTRQRYLKIVEDEAERLERIVGDLLDLARLEGGGVTFVVERVSTSGLFERLWHRHGPDLEARGITLETVGADRMPEIQGDTARLEQVLQNLVANALRHTPSGGRITVTIERINAGVRLSVEDTGPGIPTEHLARIFDRFYKVDVSRAGTTTPSGSGLGLSIAQAIVLRHGGTITAGNVAGSGARFEIVLPDPPAAPGDAPPTPPAQSIA
jgi:signal transduction histidine kinase